LPHIIDTLLLGSAVSMLVIWKSSPLDFGWLTAKILALLAYIGLGMVTLRFARSEKGRQVAYGLALASAAYIMSVAYTKSAAGLMSLAWG
jgi:uncharacterized membrane protein SirB2